MPAVTALLPEMHVRGGVFLITIILAALSAALALASSLCSSRLSGWLSALFAVLALFCALLRDVSWDVLLAGASGLLLLSQIPRWRRPS